MFNVELGVGDPCFSQATESFLGSALQDTGVVGDGGEDPRVPCYELGWRYGIAR